MHTTHLRRPEAGVGLLVAFSLALIFLCPAALLAQQAPPRDKPAAAPIKLTPEQRRSLARARVILKETTLPEAEQELRLRILDAALAGMVMSPDDASPEARNPKHWTLANGVYVVAPESTASEAISDLWLVHEHDNVPVPRIWCYKYASLTIAKGYIQYFRDTNNAAGVAAIDALIDHKEFPRGLPNKGNGLFWTRHSGGDNLLPGDQVWFENPYYDRGKEVIRREAYQQAIDDGKTADEATAAAAETTAAYAVGEEGSNIFYLGDGMFVRGGSSVARLFRGSFRPVESEGVCQYVINRRIFSLAEYQAHMIDDNYTVQAFMRVNPGVVRPADFKLEGVRSPINPETFLKLATNADPDVPLEILIDAMASRNAPPKLVARGGETIPLFGERYDWAEQQRVRSAIDAVLRNHSDAMWWRLRARLGDPRYAFTATRGGTAENFTVGAICADILSARLCLAHTTHLPSVPGRLPLSFRPEEEYWKHEKEWARDRKPLYEMQIALCEKAIAQWATVERTEPCGDGRSHVFTADEKARYPAGLKSQIEDLRQTKKAVYEEVLLPWRVALGGWEGFDAESAKEAARRLGR